MLKVHFRFLIIELQLHCLEKHLGNHQGGYESALHRKPCELLMAVARIGGGFGAVARIGAVCTVACKGADEYCVGSLVAFVFSGAILAAIFDQFICRFTC